MAFVSALFRPLASRLRVLFVLLAAGLAVAGGLVLWAALGNVPFISLSEQASSSLSRQDSGGPTTSLALAEALPPGFTVDVLSEGFTAPIAIALAPGETLFVAEQGGAVWVIQDGGRRVQPFIDLSDEVNHGWERGLLALAVDPSFEENGWVYLGFVVDPVFGEPDEPPDAVTYSRVVRYRATEESGRTEADLDSRQVLIGGSAGDGIPLGSNTHAIGDLAFAGDGTLFVSAGDGAHWEFVDYGQDDNEYDPEFELMFGPEQDIGALRAQSVASLSGKILRVDPSTGAGLPSNPFFTGDPNENASKVWALGFRNPYRIAVPPDRNGADVLYVADVGWNDWEEIDAITAGDNGGWPCYEGPDVQERFWSEPETRERCEGLHQEDTVTPTLAYRTTVPEDEETPRRVVVGGFFYRAPSQEAWDDRYFYADFMAGFIRALSIGEDGEVLDDRLFAEGLDGPVDLAQGDCGEIYVVEVVPGRILKILPPTPVGQDLPGDGPCPERTTSS